MIKCIKAEGYKDKDGNIYLDWYGESSNGIVVHIPKLDISIEDINYKYNTFENKVTAKPVFKCVPIDILSKEHLTCYLEYDRSKDCKVESLTDEMSIFSDDENWLATQREHYILRGYKIVSESYLDGKYYCDLVKE